MWDETGMSDGFNSQLKKLSHRKGFHVIPADQAILSLQAVLAQAESSVYVGIDRQKDNVGRFISSNVAQIDNVLTLYTEDSVASFKRHVDAISLQDPFSSPLPINIVSIKPLPRDSSGHIDLSLLQDIRSNGVANKGEKMLPRTEVETIVFDIWKNVLGISRLGIQDNFFDLGGHSLMATQVISRAREKFGVNISVGHLFESATIEKLSTAIERLQQYEQSTVEQIPVASRAERMLLSLPQQRIWFLQTLEGASSTWNVPIAIRLQGDMNISALERSLNDIVQRHELLRSSIQQENGIPYFDIAQSLTTTLPVVELTADNKTKQLNGCIEKDANLPIALNNAPLLRTSLYKMDVEHHVLVINTHHIISDGWSIGVFVKELVENYGAHVHNRLPSLAKLPIQYADYSQWQHEYVQTPSVQQQYDYWLEKLNGVPPVVTLPTDRARPAIMQTRGEEIHFFWDQDITDKINSFAKRNHATLYMVLLAAFKLLLSRYCHHMDIMVGSPIANRTRQELEGLIGLFVNTLVMRTTFNSEDSFQSLLEKVKTTTLDAYENQDVPFEQLVEALVDSRTASTPPLFQTMFILQNSPMDELNLFGLNVTPIPRESTVSKVDLTLTLFQQSDGLEGRFEFNTGLYDRETIAEFIENYRFAIEELISEPDISLQQVDVLATNQREQLLTKWNQTEVAFNEESLSLNKFAAHVLTNPDRPAAYFGSECLSYAELEVRSDQLARGLLESGVATKQPIALCSERSLDMLIAILGILKAGCSYIPVDPDYPADRVAYMLEHGQPAGVIVDDNSQVRFTDGDLNDITSPVFLLDTLYQRGSNSDKLLPEIAFQQQAYTIYTSGSTGKPKGVMINHRSMSNFLLAMEQEVNADQGTRLLAVTSLSFDISVLELMLPLYTGGCVVIASREESMDGNLLSALIHDQEINLLQATPATWYLLLQSRWQPPRCESDRDFIALCGGEPLVPDLARQLLKLALTLYNVYGPTEATVWSSCYRVSKVDSDNIPIGAPIANTQYYVLDELLRPVPRGAIGELYIGGEGVSDGYLNSPELTEERFIENPYLSETSGRLYRTGDLVRYRRDGELECLGRADSQVKLRGFRIELGEIESVLNSHSAIERVAVIIADDPSGQPQLIAYYSYESSANNKTSQSTCNADALKDYLKNRLPDYMVPIHIISLEQLPLTPNGKIDRKQLPEITPTEDKIVMGATTPVEKELVGLWQEMLHIEYVSIDDNFFSLGGHSLLAMQMVSKIENIFGVKLPVSIFMQASTIEQLAKYLNHKTKQDNAFDTQDAMYNRVVCLKGGDNSRSPLVLIHPVGGELLCYKSLLAHMDLDQRVYGIAYDTSADELNAVESIASLARVYKTWIEDNFQNQAIIVGGWSFGGIVATEIINQFQSEGREKDALILIDSHFVNPVDALPPTVINRMSKITLAYEYGFGASALSLVNENSDREFVLAASETLVGQQFGVKKLEQQLGLLESNYQLLNSYEMPRINVPCLLVRATQTLLMDNMAGDHSWMSKLAVPLIIKMETNHFDIVNDRYVNQLSKLIASFVRSLSS
ncbi:MAG: amino acid adenylation domain-containing protein [Pseudomonadales bacterium]|nr:amino acid adenylation domain-containing protein [Pseudomonadales bacterium]